MQIQPYLSFNGRCEEAIEFYKKSLGAQVEALMRFKENPQPEYNPPGSDNKVMHACLRIGESTLMASDGACTGGTKFEGITLSVQAATVPEAELLFAALAEGGKVTMPMTETFFSPRFGMLEDKFGVAWMVVVAK